MTKRGSLNNVHFIMLRNRAECCLILKGEVSREFAVISFKTQKCLSVSRNNEIIVKFVINYHPIAIKLSIGASGQRQSRPVWIET